MLEAQEVAFGTQYCVGNFLQLLCSLRQRTEVLILKVLARRRPA